MRIDFRKIEDTQSYPPLPEGKYLCRVENVEEDSTKNGDEMWKLRFRVIEGKYEGRCIFDNMVFSEKAMPRVKLICSRLGIDVSGEVELEPAKLINRECYVFVVINDDYDYLGEKRKKNVVPFAGYESVGKIKVPSNDEQEAEIEEDEIPF